MKKFNEYNKFFFIFLVNILIIVLLSFGMFYYFMKGKIPPNVYLHDEKIDSDVNNQNIINKLDKIYKKEIKGKYMTLSGDIDFKINLDYIEVKIDYEETLENINNLKTGLNKNLIKDYFGKEKKYIYPYVTLNDKRLKEKIDEYANYIDREPSEEELILENREVSKLKESRLGYEVDKDKVYKKVIEELNKKIYKEFIFYMDMPGEVEIIKTKKESMKNLEKFQYLVSFYNTKISSGKNINLIKKILKKLDMTLIKEFERGSNNKFSLHQVVDNEDLFFETKNDEFSQIASTLNGAVLLADFDNKIEKSFNKVYKDYIEPGVDVNFDIDNDYCIENLEKNAYLIIAKMEENLIEISILAKNKKKYSTDLEINIDNVIKKQFVYLKDESLKSGEKKIKSMGRDGLKATVNIVRYYNGAKKKEQLFDNTYTPIEQIIYISEDNVLK